VYEIPGELFQVPTAYVWIFTARLVTGKGLPYMATEWAFGAGVLFVIFTLVRTFSVGKPWRSWVPGGIAVAVGMYNVPSFTLARAIGGVGGWIWVHKMKRSNTPLIILASVSDLLSFLHLVRHERITNAHSRASFWARDSSASSTLSCKHSKSRTFKRHIYGRPI
jgi:OPT oligopeptide transporter protein